MRNYETIFYGEGAYMWIVIDTVSKENWLFYDGGKAHDFAKANQNRFGNTLWVDTIMIEDMKEENKEKV